MPDRKLLRYALLLCAQTACAAVMLANIHAGFRILIENIGTPNAPAPAGVLVLLIAAALGQACYWYRLRNVPVPTSYRNIALGHLMAFASRLGFIFGGSLFSVYFLRHAPEMALGPLDIAWRGALLIAILFSLYCYTLELERLGGALQLPPKL
ncbi:MAG TPA: hypothetical protein VIU82_11970 [Bosea sp. (in: a-proteobacteria)]